MRSIHSFPKLKTPSILSPMAGVTDIAFRCLAKKRGAGMTCTEFVNSTALSRGSKKSLNIIRFCECEKPVAVQLFGSDVKDVISAGLQVQKDFDVIDINCGCPAWKVIKGGAGSALLKNPENISKLIASLANAISKPITVKIRSGIDSMHINAVQVARIAEEAGAAAITIHGRTQQQGFSGSADWDIISEVKQAVDIPVIGNGDVFSPELFIERLEESGVDAIMIGRGAIGNPSIFRQINDLIRKGSYEQQDKIADFFEYAALAKRFKMPFSAIRAQALSFTKGISGSARLRNHISRCKDMEELSSGMEKARASE